MRTFYVDPQKIHKGKVIIEGDEYHHARDVIRIKRGDRIRGIDGNGREYILEVQSIIPKKKAIETIIIGEREALTEPRTNVYLGFGLVKGTRIDYLIEKATEVGVSGLVPIRAERSVVKGLEKKERWIKIALSAVKQSGRAKIPKIFDPIDFDKALDLLQRFEQGLIATPSSSRRLDSIKLKNDILILLGPEGGFTTEEIERARGAGFITFSMGPRILRTETAAVSALSLIFYLRGEI